jgi:glycosyltransferase involved in cell wall biosynthesis
MKIAVNTRLLLKGKMEGIGWFSHEVLQRMVINHPEHEFYFIFDRPYHPAFIFAKNVHPVVIGPPARHPALFVIWFEWSLVKALNQIKPDVFFSPDGYLSLRTNFPSVPVIHDLNFEHYPEDLPWLVNKYYRYFFPKFAKKAAKIITVSEFSKADIHNSYSIDNESIAVVPNGLRDFFRPLPENQQQHFRKEYASGKRYFLFVGALHPRKNIVSLLKAYDLYRSEGGVVDRLLIAGGTYWWNKKLKMAFETMNHKNEVIFTGHLSQEHLAQAFASAEALVYVPYFEGFGVPIIEAFASGTPVIAGNRSSLPEVAGEAALLVDPFDIKQIAAAMKSITESPELRHELIAKGVKRATLFSWDDAAVKVWDILVSVVK